MSDIFAHWAEHGTDIQKRHAAGRAELVAGLPRPSVTEVMASIAAVKACPHFSRTTGCGCNFGRCSKFDRPTSYRECLDCGEYRR